VTDPDARVPRLFLSYSRHEHDDVRHLAQVIQKSGFAPFVDEAGLEGGHPWWDQLLLQIKHCDAFVPVLSAHYLDSVPCRREAEWAEALAKPVMPVMLERVDPQAMPPYIALSQWVAFTNRDEDELIALTRTLWKLPPCPPLPDPLPTPPVVPISQVNALATSVAQRLDTPEDLTRNEQAVLLSDLKSLHAKSPEAARPLLARLQDRDEVTASVHGEITSLLGTAMSPPRSAVPSAMLNEHVAVSAPTPGTSSQASTQHNRNRAQKIAVWIRWFFIVCLVLGASLFFLTFSNPEQIAGARKEELSFGVLFIAVASLLIWWDVRSRRKARSRRSRS